MAAGRDEIYVDPPIDRQRSSRDADHLIAQLAERQHGVVARRQLLACGIGGGAIDKRVKRGRLHTLHRGVYAVGHRVVSPRGRWMAAVLASGPGAVLSHRSAAMLWGLLPASRATPEVTKPTAIRLRQGLRVHRSELGRDEMTGLDGIPVSSPSRTLFDLATTVTEQQLEKAFNEAEVQRITDRLSVADLLRRYPGRRGSVALKRIIVDRETAWGITREELERRFAAVLAHTDLPRPRRNVHIAAGGRFFEVDCLWAEQRLVIELDGRATHGTDRAFEGDREKDRLLLVDGWHVVRITWRQLRDDAPAVVADLRRLLRKDGQAPTL